MIDEADVTRFRERIGVVRERIEAAARQAGRAPEDVTLVGVSKTHPPEAVAAAVRAGLEHVGESRVQEAAAKAPRVSALLGDAAPPTWHLVGHLQTNKINAALSIFQRIDAVDSVHLAGAISRRIAPQAPLVPVLLEVYVGDDPRRPGFRPHDLEETAGEILGLPGLRVDGLMTVAPLGWDADATQRAFREVRLLRDRLAARYPRGSWHELSMGMSEDFELAIAEGATSVRIGRAIFGSRQAP